MTASMPDLHVIVRFGKGVPYDVQAKGLFECEKLLRDVAEKLTGERLWIEVFKETMGDDSKLRVLMTPEQRKNL